MSYRLGESLSALVRATADGANTVDSSVLTKLAATSTTSFTTLSLTYIRNSVQALAGRAVRPMEGNDNFVGVIHPFALGDVLADNSNNSPIDILKRTPQGYARLDEIISTDLNEVIEIPSSGVAFFQTNLVTTSSNYNPGTGAVSGLTALRTYIFGYDGIYFYNLAANGDTAFGDGNYQNIRTNIVQNPATSVADPSGLIGGWTSYKVHATTGLGPDTTIRQRQIDAGSAIS